MRFMKMGVLAALVLATPALPQAFRPGDPVRDSNPSPVKLQCWNGTAFAACSLSGGGGSGGDASAANQAAVQAVPGSDATKAVAVQGVTNGKAVPVSASSLPLPSGAATSANQAPVATAGSAAPSVGTMFMGTDGTNARAPIIANTGDAFAATTYRLATSGFNYVYNGTSSDRQRDATSASATTGIGLAGAGVLCRYMATPATLTDLQFGTARCDTRQNIIVALGTPDATTLAAYANDNNDAVSATSTINKLGTVARGFYYNGTTYDRVRGDTTGAYVVPTPTAAAANALGTVSAAGATTAVLKSTPGNVYSINVVNSTVAGFVVLYDATAAPSGGAALTASLTRWCFPLAASAALDKVFQMPMNTTNGSVLLASTSCTTYTALATAPIIMIGQVK